MSQGPVRYRSSDEDSARWLGFDHRSGDIVISTRSKHGTTWMQMICALLVLKTSNLPAPLARLSPWLDWLLLDRDEVYAELAAQRHRRFIKTHTPLDGLPLDPRVTYVVVARHPLDAAVSLYHQGVNLDRARIRRLTGQPQPPAADHPAANRPTLEQWLTRWVDHEADPRTDLDSLPGVMHHLSDAWARRGAGDGHGESSARVDVVLVHYDDLSTDLDGQMRRLADRLRITVPEHAWPDLVAAAGFEAMRSRARFLAPDPVGVLLDRSLFFRSGRSGTGRAVLSDADLAPYSTRASRLAPADLLAWLHRPSHR